ncbi:MAG: ACT domain-containing protein [Desulfobacterales bacterium]|nr:ACT domain-containing protein [Desulfobacterales bacterium]
MKKFVISVLGQDRPGIIATVSGILFEQGCNIENVDQTILQSEFSGIFIAGIPVEMDPVTLHAKLIDGVKDLELHVFIKPLDHSQPKLEFGESEPFVLTTRGPDKKGLVASITRVIADYGVNVTNLQAVFRGTDNPSDNIMIYEVDVPADVNQKNLQADLRHTAARLGLEISIQHRKIFEALNRI